MKKRIKWITIVIIVFAVLIIVDISQAKVFARSLIFAIPENYNRDCLLQKKKGILTDTYICINQKQHTVFKWETYSCKEHTQMMEELNYINNQIVEYMKTSDNHNISSCGIDNYNNVVVIALMNNTKEEQDKIKKNVENPSLLKFEQGNKNHLY